MLNEFLTWWTRQLLSLLPGAWRSGDAGRGDAVILALVPAPSAAPSGAPSAGSIDLILRRRGRDGALGRFPLTEAGALDLARAIGAASGPAELRLPAGMMLDQPVMLPIAAERDLGRVLGYEMDRLTPFRTDDVFWTWRIERRDRLRAQLHLRLYLTPKAPLLPVLQTLGTARIRPATLAAGPVSVALQGEAAGPWRRRVNTALAAGCVVLAVGAVGAPFIRQARESHSVERHIASLRPLVDQADALRRQVGLASGGSDVLAAQRVRSGNALEILATLTNALPDDTVLTDLTLQSRSISISGQSAAAARLIGVLAADPALRNPSFAAPVTRNDTTKTEGFSIRAEMTP